METRLTSRPRACPALRGPRRRGDDGPGGGKRGLASLGMAKKCRGEKTMKRKQVAEAFSIFSFVLIQVRASLALNYIMKDGFNHEDMESSYVLQCTSKMPLSAFDLPDKYTSWIDISRLRVSDVFVCAKKDTFAMQNANAKCQLVQLVRRT